LATQRLRHVVKSAECPRAVEEIEGNLAGGTILFRFHGPKDRQSIAHIFADTLAYLECGHLFVQGWQTYLIQIKGVVDHFFDVGLQLGAILETTIIMRDDAKNFSSLFIIFSVISGEYEKTGEVQSFHHIQRHKW